MSIPSRIIANSLARNSTERAPSFKRGSLKTPTSPSQLLKEAEIGGGIEDGFLAVVEPRAPKFDGAENLHALAFSGYGDFRRAPDAAPGGVERRVLPEAGFVGEEESPVSRAGFFLSAG